MDIKPGEHEVFSLLENRMISNYSEAWRHECECRTVLRMPSRAQRVEYVDGRKDHAGKVVKRGIRKVRGDAAADRLKNDATRLHGILLERNEKP